MPFTSNYALNVQKHTMQARRVGHLQSNFQNWVLRQNRENAFAHIIVPANQYRQDNAPLAGEITR